MRISLFWLTFLCLIAVISCKTTLHLGRYGGSDYTRGMSFKINGDSTFEYSLLGHMISDTSAGRYRLVADTISFNYSYDLDSSTVLHPSIPQRPKFALIRTNKLFLFYPADLEINKRQALRLYK